MDERVTGEVEFLKGTVENNSFTEGYSDLPRRSGAYLEAKADTCTRVDYIVSYTYVADYVCWPIS